MQYTKSLEIPAPALLQQRPGPKGRCKRESRIIEMIAVPEGFNYRTDVTGYRYVNKSRTLTDFSCVITV